LFFEQNALRIGQSFLFFDQNALRIGQSFLFFDQNALRIVASHPVSRRDGDRVGCAKPI